MFKIRGGPTVPIPFCSVPRDANFVSGFIGDAGGSILTIRYKIGLGANRVAKRGGETRQRIIEAAQGTKRTLYYHFESNDALVAVVLDSQNELELGRIRRWADKACGEPDEIVANLFAEMEEWAKQPGWHGAGFTRIAMELADLPGHPVRAAASRHNAAVARRLAEHFAAKGVRQAAVLARQVALLIEGSQALALIHGDLGYVKAAEETARKLVGNARPG
jgi:AcrR family transcriptional regulator